MATRRDERRARERAREARRSATGPDRNPVRLIDNDHIRELAEESWAMDGLGEAPFMILILGGRDLLARNVYRVISGGEELAPEAIPVMKVSRATIAEIFQRVIDSPTFDNEDHKGFLRRTLESIATCAEAADGMGYAVALALDGGRGQTAMMPLKHAVPTGSA